MFVMVLSNDRVPVDMAGPSTRPFRQLLVLKTTIITYKLLDFIILVGARRTRSTFPFGPQNDLT